MVIFLQLQVLTYFMFSSGENNNVFDIRRASQTVNNATLLHGNKTSIMSILDRETYSRET